MAKRSGLSARSGSIQAAIIAAKGRGPAKSEEAPNGRSARERDKTVGLTVRLDQPTHDRLRKIAFDERVSIHSLLLEGIEATLAKRK